MGRDPSWDRRGPPLGVRDRRRPIFRGLLRALRRRQQTPIPIAAPEPGVRSAQASASGAGRPSWLGGDCGTIDDCRGGILADRGGDRARVIGSNERQDAMAGVEYQRCFLAQAAGIRTRPANIPVNSYADSPVKSCRTLSISGNLVPDLPPGIPGSSMTDRTHRISVTHNCAKRYIAISPGSPCGPKWPLPPPPAAAVRMDAGHG